MVEIKIEGTPYRIPAVWSEVTLAQYRDMVRNREDLSPERLLSILTGIEYDLLMNVDASKFTEKKIFDRLLFVKTRVNFIEMPRPKNLVFGDKTIPVIEDPKREKLGQKLKLQQIMNRAHEKQLDFPEIAAEVLATYYAPKFDLNQLWKEEKVAELIPVIEKMPVTVVLPEANFFLRGFITRSKRKES